MVKTHLGRLKKRRGASEKYELRKSHPRATILPLAVAETRRTNYQRGAQS